MEQTLDITTKDGLLDVQMILNDELGRNDNVDLLTINSTLEKTVAAGAQTIEAGNTAGFWETIGNALVILFRKRKLKKSCPANIPPNKQLVLARTLIETGKESGVKKMTIVVAKEVVAALRGTYMKASITDKVGVDNKFYIEVEYN